MTSKIASEVLEQEPYEDCISRQEAILQIQKYGVGCFIEEDFSPEQCERFVISKLRSLPSVTPKEKTGWIPVSERLPDEETDVLVWCETGAITVCCGSYSTEVSDTFIWYTGGWRYGKVIAWMPLPEPYKPQESEDKE